MVNFANDQITFCAVYSACKVKQRCTV